MPLRDLDDEKRRGHGDVAFPSPDFEEGRVGSLLT